MKQLKEAFVIVKHYGGIFSFFEDYISFNKEEIDLKCEWMNKEANDAFEKTRTKRDAKQPFTPSVIFIIMDLEKAIDKFRDDVSDHYTEHDASY